MRKTTLVIMAAGIGSRFGQGIKQLTSFGPSGEIIMDYSIYDAIEAGFDKVVFVIRRDLEADFKEIIGNRIAQKVEVDYAFQEMDDLPEGFTLPEGRKKPWGTGQAILSCHGVVKEPFAVINADDYYGKEAFTIVHDYLVKAEAHKDPEKPMDICMAGFVLSNTLSEHGGVTRGICTVDENGILQGIAETGNIIKTPEGAAVKNDDGSLTNVDPAAIASMNFWGFPAEMLDDLKERFAAFLGTLEGEKLCKGEFLLPSIVDDMLKEGKATVTICPSNDRWFGVTYAEDTPVVKEAFKNLIEKGVYQPDLWA